MNLGLKFSVFAPAQENTDLPEIEVEPVQTAPTQDLSDQGMPSIAERAAETEVSRDGMPQRVSVPKPAPIPEGVDIHAQPEQTPVAIEEFLPKRDSSLMAFGARYELAGRCWNFSCLQFLSRGNLYAAGITTRHGQCLL